jgi:ribosome-associated protein
MQRRNNDLHVNGRVTIPRDEIDVQASRSGGPGGQHVNTSSTRIEVRWNLQATRALTDEEKTRVREKLGSRIDADGTIRVTSSESRSQHRNRDLAEGRLAELVRRALVVPKTRRATRRPRRAEEARLHTKRERANLKKGRRWQGDD